MKYTTYLLIGIFGMVSCRDSSERSTKSSSTSFKSQVEITSAVNTNNEVSVEEWLQSGGDPNAGGISDGINPVHMAASMHRVALLKLFATTSKVAWNQADKKGYTPLHYAASSWRCQSLNDDKAKTIMLLLNSGADPNIADNEGNTAADLASSVTSDPIAVELLTGKIEVSADQPATAPESKPLRSEKPQPEAEGRSR
jgi:Ankyrin repeats (3 copies)